MQLLEHEQRALVQPNFDRLSCSSAWLVSIGSATSFEVHGVRQEIADFTSFYLYSLTRGIPHALRARKWPRITRFDDRWRWLATSVVPRFRRFDADTHLVDASLRHIFDEARDFASSPCVLPRSPADGPRRAAQPRLWHRPRGPFITGSALFIRQPRCMIPLVAETDACIGFCDRLDYAYYDYAQYAII